MIPTRRDPRDRKFHHALLFGTAQNFLPEYNADVGVITDQIADNRPTECTAYTCTDIARNEDGVEYSHDYHFMKTLQVEGLPPENTVGADARTAFKVGAVFGFLPKDKEPSDMRYQLQAWAANQSNWSLELDSSTSKKPVYTPVSPLFGQDWFDAVRSVLALGDKKTVGVATQWSPDFENRLIMGVMPENPSNLSWGHMYSIVGWKQISGQPYLIAKTWQGKNYGDKGYCYISRTLFNNLMKTWGTYAATYEIVSELDISQIKQQQIHILEVIVAFLENLIRIKFTA